jgi:hypothetical protein
MNPLTWLKDAVTGFDREEYEASQEADARNRQLTEDLKSRGLISEQDYDQSIKNYNDSASYDPDKEIGKAFGQGIDEGAANIRNLAGDTINAAIGTPLKLIPWQVWLAAALYVAWRLGLFNGILAKARR